MVFHHSHRNQRHHCPPPLPLLSSGPSHPFSSNFEITSFLSISSLLCILCVLRLGSSLVCSQPTRGPIVKENWLSLPRPLSYVNRSSASGGITSLPSPPLTEISLGLELTQVLCMLLKSLWVHMCICPACVWKMVSLMLSILSGSYKTFHSLFHKDPWAFLGRGVIWMSNFRLNTLHIDQLLGRGASGLIGIYCEEKFLWWGLEDAVVYGYSNKSFLLPCSFRRLIVLIFFPSACGLCSHRFLTPMVVSSIDFISWSRPLMQTENIWLLWWFERKYPP